MSRRGALVEDPGVLRCGRPPCPVATVGQFVEVAFTTPMRREFTGSDDAVGRVKAVTPALHGLLIEGPKGDLIVGGHGSTDRVKALGNG